MIQVRFFKLEEWKECNKFMETTRPRGEKGFIANASGFTVVYESGHPMDRLDKLAKLKFLIGTHSENILTYEREMLVQEETIKEFEARPDEKEYEKKKFRDYNQTLLNGKKKMIELEQISLRVVEKMYKQVEKQK